MGQSLLSVTSLLEHSVAELTEHRFMLKDSDCQTVSWLNLSSFAFELTKIGPYFRKQTVSLIQGTELFEGFFTLKIDLENQTLVIFVYTYPSEFKSNQRIFEYINSFK